MITISRHHFGKSLHHHDQDYDEDEHEEEEDDDDDDDGDETRGRGREKEGEGFSLSISEVMKEDHGLHVWPCSLVLAEYVWQQRQRFGGYSVVELGAGTSLPGLVAAKVGAFVTLTDQCGSTEVFENIQRICEENQVVCRVEGLTWGSWDSACVSLRPDIVLGADVLYDSKDFDDLFATVSFFLRNNPSGVFITTYQQRSGHWLIEFLLSKWKLQCVKLLDSLEFMPPSKSQLISSSIHLVEIKLKL